MDFIFNKQAAVNSNISSPEQLVGKDFKLFIYLFIHYINAKFTIAMVCL